MDILPSMFLKDGAVVIAYPLYHIINLSLHSGQIPEDMKNARVVGLRSTIKKNLSIETIYRSVSIINAQAFHNS